MLELVRERIPGWRARIAFAAVLLVFSEWIVWQTPLDFNVGEWLAWGAVYLALAGLVLDLIARFKVNDVFSLLLVAGIYGLLNATLISHITTRDLPLSLIVRPLGAQPLALMGALAAYQVLGSGRATGPLDFLVAALAGLAWGVWTRWFPVVSDETLPEVARGDALAALGIALVALLVIVLLLHPSPQRKRVDWMLTPIEWAVVVIVLGAALLAGLEGDAYSGLGLGIVVSLLGFLLMVLYVSLVMRGDQTLLDTVTPPKTPLPMAWVVLIIPFLVAGALGFSLPGGETRSVQSDILIAALTAFGIAWPPGVASVVGMRAFIRLSREGL
jgi:hypothetical protein